MQRLASGRITLAFGLIAAGLIAGLQWSGEADFAAVASTEGGNGSLRAGGGALGNAAKPAAPPAPVTVRVDPDSVSNPMRIQAPQQVGECPVAGVARFVSANWECPAFPGCSSSRWVVYDQFASIRTVTDEIQWGRVEGESTVGFTSDKAGSYSSWSVGGGSVGKKLSVADKAYPGVGGNPCRPTGACRINTSLQFNSFDASNVVGGLRIVFDYKAKMPSGSRFFIAIANFAARDDNGNITALKAYESEFQRDTAGEWVRGTTLAFPEAAGVAELLITFTYINDPATTDGYGIFIDNVHLDALFNANAPPCPSPATPAPTETNTRVASTKTPTRIVIPTKTKTPTPRPDGRKAVIPYVLRAGQLRPAQPTVVPTAPTGTNTVTPSPEPTETPEPTWTSRPTDTPQPTPTSTRTPEPEPDLIIERILYKRLPGGFAVQIVDLFNQGTGDQATYRWNVTGTVKVPPTDCRFTDPNGKIGGGEHYYILAGTEADEQALVEPYLGRSMVCKDEYIFDQNSDRVLLLTDGRDPKDMYCWYQFGPYECSP